MIKEHLQVKITQKALITIEDKILMVLEGDTWELPGGRVNEDETDLITALKRELKEELSLEIDIQKIFTCYIFSKPSGEIALAIIYHCRLLTPIDGIKKQLGEIDNWKLFSKEELKELKNIYPNSALAIKEFLKE